MFFLVKISVYIIQSVHIEAAFTGAKLCIGGNSATVYWRDVLPSMYIGGDYTLHFNSSHVFWKQCYCVLENFIAISVYWS